jgi:hypothetical protein
MVCTGYYAILLLHFIFHEYPAVKYVSVIYFCSADFQNLFKFRPFFVQISAIFRSKVQILVCAFRPEFSEILPKFRISPISPRSGKKRKPKTETLGISRLIVIYIIYVYDAPGWRSSRLPSNILLSLLIKNLSRSIGQSSMSEVLRTPKAIRVYCNFNGASFAVGRWPTPIPLL